MTMTAPTIVLAALIALPAPKWQPLDEWTVTAYCPCPKCCGRFADGYFADGTSCSEVADKTVVAAPPSIPLGTVLYVEGLGQVLVRDRGGAIKGHRLDLFFHSHDDALRWGVRQRRVWKKVP